MGGVVYQTKRAKKTMSDDDSDEPTDEELEEYIAELREHWRQWEGEFDSPATAPPEAGEKP